MIISFLAIVLVVMLAVGFVMYNMLERYYVNYQKEIMSRSGNLAAAFVRGYLTETEEVDSVRLSSLAENFSMQSYPQSRIIILDRTGRVVGDSLRVGGMLGDIMSGDEVQTALGGETGFSVRYSENLEYWVMQVAVPVMVHTPGDLSEDNSEEASAHESDADREESARPDNMSRGVVFLSASLEEIHGILADIRLYLIWSTLAAVVLATIASFFLARRFTEPLALLSIAARNMAEGEFEQRISVDSKDEIGQLAGQFNFMAERINYMTRNLKSFAANVSHELRTPLTTVNLLIKSLQEHEMSPEQQQEFLLDIEKETERLTNLVTDLLELTKLESFRAKEQKKQFSLRTVLLELLEQMAPWFEKARISFISDIPLAVMPVAGSPIQVRQVIYNLADNALKYTQPGGRVVLSAHEEDDKVIVRVVDTGRGIPENKLSYIFERFYRVDEARSRDHGGIGLGLAIVKEIVEAHGGDISVESEEGTGSVFTVVFPKASHRE